MLETELKCMLDRSTYETLEKMFEWDWVKEQTNHYYTDPKGELKQSGITFRVRTKDGINKIQVKTHKNAGSPLQICEESEYPTETVPEKFSAEDIKRMTGLNTEASLLGSLTTLRRSLMYCGGVEICLDKNDYLDRTDYEIEVEYTSPVPPELYEKLAEAGVTFTAASVGKCTRFMRRLYDILHNN